MTNYREINAKNYSSLSRLDEGPWNLNIDLDTKAFDLGTGVDLLLFDGLDKYNEVVSVSNVEPPTATLLEVVNYCYENNFTDDWLIESYVNQKGENGKFLLWQTTTNLEKRKEKWNTSDFKNYLNYLIQSTNKIKLSSAEDADVKYAVEMLKTHEFTKSIFNQNGNSQLILVEELEGMLFKGKLDWVVIDEKNKIIYPYDLKTTSKYLKSFRYSVLKYRYDIQSSLYTHLLQKKYPDYTIADFRMIVYSFAQRSIEIFNMKKYKDISKVGFVHKDENVKGWLQLAHEYDWHLENELYQHEMNVYLNKGEIIL